MKFEYQINTKSYFSLIMIGMFLFYSVGTHITEDIKFNKFMFDHYLNTFSFVSHFLHFFRHHFTIPNLVFLFRLDL